MRQRARFLTNLPCRSAVVVAVVCLPRVERPRPTLVRFHLCIVMLAHRLALLRKPPSQTRGLDNFCRRYERMLHHIRMAYLSTPQAEQIWDATFVIQLPRRVPYQPSLRPSSRKKRTSLHDSNDDSPRSKDDCPPDPLLSQHEPPVDAIVEGRGVVPCMESVGHITFVPCGKATRTLRNHTKPTSQGTRIFTVNGMHGKLFHRCLRRDHARGGGCL